MPVQQSCRVQRVERGEQAFDQGTQFTNRGGGRARSDHALEALAGHQRHDAEHRVVRQQRVEDTHQARLLNPGQRESFVVECLARHRQRDRIPGMACAHRAIVHAQRQGAREELLERPELAMTVAGAIDKAMRTLVQHLVDHIGAHRHAGWQGHCRRRSRGTGRRRCQSEVGALRGNGGHLVLEVGAGRG